MVVLNIDERHDMFERKEWTNPAISDMGLILNRHITRLLSKLEVIYSICAILLVVGDTLSMEGQRDEQISEGCPCCNWPGWTI
jgi:hypothetical protein